MVCKGCACSVQLCTVRDLLHTDGAKAHLGTVLSRLATVVSCTNESAGLVLLTIEPLTARVAKARRRVWHTSDAVLLAELLLDARE